MRVILLYSMTDLGLFTAENDNSARSVIFSQLLSTTYTLTSYTALGSLSSDLERRREGVEGGREGGGGEVERGKGKGERRKGKEKRKRKGRGDMEARRGIKGRRERRRETERGGKRQSVILLFNLFLPFVCGNPA